MTTKANAPTEFELHVSQPRDVDELEGALLPPTAVALDDSTCTEVAAATVAVEAFVYLAYEQDALTAEADLPTAPSLPQYQSMSMRQQREQSAIAKGKRRGVIEADSEKEAIAKASRETYAKDWHAKRQVEAANAEARRRNKEGVQVGKDKYTTVGAATPCTGTKEEEPAFPTSYNDGYHVQEYDVSEYKGADDYEVSEYKSVYD
jgi:hypothetical protein